MEATVTGSDGSVLEIAPADGMAKEKLNLVFVTVHIDSVIAKQDGVDLTDDCAAVERMGMSVKLVEGAEENLKVTTPMDLKIAEMLLEEAP